MTCACSTSPKRSDAAGSWRRCHGLCKVDPWFLHRIRRLVEMEQELIARSGEVREVLSNLPPSLRFPPLREGNQLPTVPPGGDGNLKELPSVPPAGRGNLKEGAANLLRRAKEWQFGDRFLAQITGLSEAQVREGRKALGILPAFKMVDTCAGEFEAHTPYFYSTYHGVSDRHAPKHPRKALVLGSGPIRIGQGIEFDYSAVHAVRTLREMGYYAIILNNNPETVSTDFDISDALYFDPITTEDVLNLLEYEAGDSGEPIPVLVQFGGQTAINLVKSLQAFGAPILGTPPESIELAEDRRQFDALLERLGVPRPSGRAVLTLDEARETAQAVGYPVLVRPSYVLGGRAMEIVRTDAELETYWRSAVLAFPDAPVLVDKYIEGKEAEVDLIGDGERFLIPAVMEHIERAGVHSGDSMTVVPPQTLTESEQAQIRDYSLRLARALQRLRAAQHPVRGAGWAGLCD
jgi:carbamoyl-phosphate synthase large subunit